jgi:hypothetical protein
LGFSAAGQRVASKPRAEPFGAEFLLVTRAINRYCQNATQFTRKRTVDPTLGFRAWSV